MSVSDFLNNAKKVTVDKTVTLEVTIEDHFVKYAKSKGCLAYKLIILNKRGFPDRTILIGDGKLFFIEFKQKGKKLSPTQITVKKILVGFGFGYYVCDEIGQAEIILNKYIN